MAREMTRQGGRSARIQQAVHKAVRDLLATTDRVAINVPLIADHARLTPSTIYRRRGDVSQLLADVAAERLRPVAEPDDTGSLEGDLTAFVLQYAEEMSSQVGRQLLHDVLAEAGSEDAATRCCQYTVDHLKTLRGRALARGEQPFDLGDAIDALIAPLVYHILFSERAVTQDYALSLLARFFDRTGRRDRD